MTPLLLSAASGITILLIVGLLYRVFRGPTPFDQVLAVNGINTQIILLLLLIGGLSGRIELFIDVAFGYVALGLIAGMAFSKYLPSRAADAAATPAGASAAPETSRAAHGGRP